MQRTCRLQPRTPARARRPAPTRLRLHALEDRSLPSFGLGWVADLRSSETYCFGNAVDGAGNVYVSGYYTGTVDFDPNQTNPAGNHVMTAGGNDGFVAKYTPGGTFQWVTDLGTDTNGAYVAARGSALYASTHGAVARLDPASGAVLWSNTAVSATNFGLAVDPAGNVDVTGSDGSRPVVAQLDPAGNVRWTRAAGGSGSGFGSAVAVDGAGTVYTTGRYSGSVTFGSTPRASWSGGYGNDAFVWKLTAAGTSAWAGSIGSSGDDWGRGVAVDGGGNVVVTGSWGYNGANVSLNSNFNPGSGAAARLTNHGYSDDFIVKLAPGKNGAMTLSWAKGIGGSGVDGGIGVAVDGIGNVYTTGAYDGTVSFNPNNGTVRNLTGGGIFVSKLDPSGNYLAAVGTASGSGTGRAVALDGTGNVYIAGALTAPGNFDPNGLYTVTPQSFDGFVWKLTQTSPQLAVGRGPNVGVAPLTQAQLAAAEATAIRDWAVAGLPAADLARMRAVKADIVTLGGNRLGAAELNGTEIAIDATADGWGWSVDVAGKPAAGRMDLLTVVMHELGHVVGLDSRFGGDPHDLMYAYLSPGERRLPGAADIRGPGSQTPATEAMPRATSEDRIDWLAAAATLKPKGGLLADWLADVG
ncbi:MAG TPA: hypothetical protein VGF55_03150 [Gemmataceae bacterium]|jgi:hypothetical protein